MAQGQTPYPVQFSVDYPEKPLDRLSTFFRLIAIIPIAVVLLLVGIRPVWSESGLEAWFLIFIPSLLILASHAAGTLFLPSLLLILFRQKYPRWWFDWNVELLKFSSRTMAYLLLLRDEYPSTDEEQAVHIEVPYPDVPNELNRWLPLIKWILAVPHYVVLFFLIIGVMVVVTIAWFAILITGRYPQGLFGFVVGVMRWGIRVSAYTTLLTTDRYPPFSLDP